MSHDDPSHGFGASKDANALLRAAHALASSAQAADQQNLLQVLVSSEFLDRLDAPQDYAGHSEWMRLGKVVEALARNPAPAARETLLRLARDETFLSEPARVDLLIEASSNVRPATAELVEFWDRYAQPDDGFIALTIHVLINNGDTAALALFERKLRDPAHEEAFKIDWLRGDVLSHRNEPELLRSCSRLLTEGGLSQRLRTTLIEALFDYRPEAWYAPHGASNPPPWEDYSPEARAELQAIARYVLAHAELTVEQRQAVVRALAKIDAM